MKDGERDNVGFGSLFKGLDKFIGVMADMIENEKDEIDIKGIINDPDKRGKVTGSYGFNIRVGADSINSKGTSYKKSPEYTEPLTDIFEEEDKVTVVIELPGVSEEDIRCETDNNSLTVTASNKSVSYKKIIPLKFEIDEKSIVKKLNNSIFSIVLNKHN